MLLLGTLPLLTSSVLTGLALRYEAQLVGWPGIYWLWATLFFTLTSALALTPPTFLALLMGYFLGWMALPLLIVLNTGAIALLYAGARPLGRLGSMEQLRRMYPSVEGLIVRFHQHPLGLIFFTKLSPVLPFAVTNVFFVMVGAKYRDVLLGGTLGMLPRTILSVWAGAMASELYAALQEPSASVWDQAIWLGLLGVSVGGILFYALKKVDK